MLKMGDNLKMSEQFENGSNFENLEVGVKSVSSPSFHSFPFNTENVHSSYKTHLFQWPPKLQYPSLLFYFDPYLR